MIGKYPRKAKYTSTTLKLLEIDDHYISPSYTRDRDFVVAKGVEREVLDVEGNWYLDFGAGIAVTSTGHCHPKVIEAIKQQADNLIHMSGTDFYYTPQIFLAKKLAKISPVFDPGDYLDGKKVMSFFCNSGAEAVEAAMKLSHYVTKRPGFVAFTGAFHGRTLGALSLTGSKAIQREGYSPLQPVAHVPYPNCAECIFNTTAQKCRKNGFECLRYLKEQVFERTFPPENVAAIFVEAIQGEGGYIVPPDGWLGALSDLAYDNDIILVVDEIQSGMGRTGKWFACDHFRVEPDIITIAKGVASGMPLGIMMASSPTMNEWEPGSHASTFGGNPIACAAALKTIEVIEREKLLLNAKTRGLQLNKGLETLAKTHECVNNPRGLGLMRAVDIHEDLRENVLKHCFNKGLILLGCGKYGIRFCPALNVTEEEVDVCLNVLEESIRETLQA